MCNNIATKISTHDLQAKENRGESDSMAQYKTHKGGQLVHIHPSSVLFASSGGRMKKLPKHVAYSDVLITTRQYMKNISVIDETWIDEIRTIGRTSKM